MASGARYKFQGSTIKISTAFAADSPVNAITAISKANPAVITDTAHGHADGDVIKIAGVVGMTEINGKTAIIDVVDANSFKALGVDSTGYTTYDSGGTYTIATMVSFCELTSLNQQDGAKAEIDVTTVCSEEAEFETGFPDPGTTQMDYNFAPQQSVQVALRAARTSGDVIAVKTVLPGTGGQVIQLGTVQQTSMSGSVNGVWKGSLTIRNSGAGAVFA